MATTSSFRSTGAGDVTRSLIDSVLLIAASVMRGTWIRLAGLVRRRFVCECLQTCAQHAVERGKRVEDVRKGLQRRPYLYGEHQLANDLACTRGDEGGADQHAAVAVADEFERATVKIM